MSPRSTREGGRSAMTENASRHERRNDPDDLTAKDDAVDIDRRSKAHAVAVDDVHASRLGRKRETATRTGPSTDAIGTGTLSAAAASASSHDRHGDDGDPVAFVGLAEQ